MRVIFRENTLLRGLIDKTWQPLAAVVIRAVQSPHSRVVSAAHLWVARPPSKAGVR
jgi:hypothetical protein